MGVGAPALLLVVPIVVSGPHGEVSATSIEAAVDATLTYRPELRVLSHEESFVLGGGTLESRVLDCGSDKGCMAERLASLGAPLALVVSVNQISDPPFVSVLLLDVRAQRVAGSASGALGPDEPSIDRAIRLRASKLLEARGFAESARIVVAATPATAQVLVDGRAPAPAMPSDLSPRGVFTVAPGRHTISATLEGHRAASAEIDALAGQDARAVLTLEEESSLLASPWLWIAIGVVGAGTAAAALLVHSRSCFCVPHRDGSGCDHC
jgi:hypothetical protein